MTRTRLIALIPHAVLILAVLLFAFPIWIAIAGSTQDSAAIARGTSPSSRTPPGSASTATCW